MNRLDNIKTSPYPLRRGTASPFGGVGGGFGLLVLICGLIFLLSACDRDVAPVVPEVDPVTQAGELVTVNFTISTDGYGDNEVVTRSAASKADDGEYIQISDDLYMYVALQEVEPPIQLRAAYPLTPGTVVRIVAYSGTTYISHADYIVSSGLNLSPVTNPLVVPSGNTQFVAYSYNNNSPLPPFVNPLTSVQANDLTWGTTTALVDRTGFTVHITMKHQYSRVKLDAQLDYNAPSPITSFNLTQPGIDAYDPDFNVQTGTLVTGPVVNFQFTRSATLPTLPNWVSDSLHIYSNSVNPTVVRFASVEVNGIVYPGPYVTQFTKALLPGNYYTLIVRFMQVIPAYILYVADDGTLSAGLWKDGQITAQNMLYFKFGGVVGFTAPPSGTSGTPWSASYIKFDPTSTVVTITGYDANVNFNNPSTINTVPSYQTSTHYNQGTPIMHTSVPPFHTGANIKMGIGDPCRLVGLKTSTARPMSAAAIAAHPSNWRLPTSAEVVEFVRAPTTWSGNITTPWPTISNSAATYWGSITVNGVNKNGGWFAIPGNPTVTTGRTLRNTNPKGFLPVTGGYRLGPATAGITSGIFEGTTTGFYWSEQVANSTFAFFLMFNQTTLYHLYDALSMTALDAKYTNAYPVRCIYTGPPLGNSNYGVSVEDWESGGSIGTPGSEGDVNL